MSVKSEPDVRRSQRLRTLTRPAHELYEQSVRNYLQELQDIKKDIDSCVENIDKEQHGSQLVIPLRNHLESCIHAFNKCSTKFVSYLHGIKTQASLHEEGTHLLFSSRVHTKLRNARDKLYRLSSTDREDNYTDDTDDSVQRSFDNRQSIPVQDPPASTHGSHISHAPSSHAYSNRSSRSTTLQRIEAKLEASRTKLKFIEEEADIIEQKAALESRLKRVRAKCEVEVLHTEAEAMRRDSTSLMNTRHQDFLPDIDERLSYKVKQERTEEFVRSLSSNANEHDFTPDKPVAKPSVVTMQAPEPISKVTDTMFVKSNLDPTVPPFVFNSRNEQYNHDSASNQQMSEFAKFLVKKDLLLSRLTKYDDTPMLYVAWKLNFKGIMAELNTSPTEELDLLIRWLGPNSSRQAASLRACNAHNASVALSKIWERLEDRFGSAEMVESSLKKKISSFPKILGNDNKRLYDLADLVTEVASVKNQPCYSVLFGYFDSSTGVNLIASKLPWNLQDKWMMEASKYKRDNNSTYPPFSRFVDFVHNMAKMRNDPSFMFDRSDRNQNKQSLNRSGQIEVKKTTAQTKPSSNSSQLCPLHKTNHSLNQCAAFRKKPLDERKKFVLKNGICFKCCGPKKHRAKNCKADVTCDICKNNSHPTAFHVGEQTEPKTVESSCTQICGTTDVTSKSCAKIVPVYVYHKDVPQNTRIMYALIDDQSSHSLASSTFFDFFMETGPVQEYTLVSCAGKVATSGRRASGYVVEAFDHSSVLHLPTLKECNQIPNNPDEIPTPELAAQFPHLQEITSLIPPLIDGAEIELLIGRDLITAHHVQDQKLGEDKLPFAQKLLLGWVVVGQVCLGNFHHSDIVSVNKTFLLQNGRPSLFEPCDSKLTVTADVFLKTEHDEKVGLSIEDQAFLRVMDSDCRKDVDGHWSSPLPFRENRPLLPNNKSQALKRARIFLSKSAS